MRYLLVGLLLPCLLFARPLSPILPPESPRVLGMGGAFVAVADDPQAALLNPAGLAHAAKIGSDQSYGEHTNHGPDKILLSYINPASEQNTSFGGGVWTEGQFHPQKFKFYVPFIAMPWKLTNTFSLGAAVRAPYRSSQTDSIANIWAAVADLSFFHGGKNLNFGGMLERAFGGESEMIPRRLKFGTAWVSDSKQLTIAYEWLADQGQKKYNFVYTSSHLGMEMLMGDYTGIRAGYIWDKEFRYTLGAVIGTLKSGWRMDAGFSLPTNRHGETLWSAGLGYRL